MRAAVATVGASLLAIIALTGCTASDGKDFAGNQIAAPTASASAAPSSAAKVFALGYEATVTEKGKPKLKVLVENPRDVAGSRYLQPEHGRFLALDVTFMALQTADINPFDFTLLLEDGERLDPTFGPDAGTELHATTLNTGEKIKGVILFDAPKTGVKGVAYAPLGQVLGTWTL